MDSDLQNPVNANSQEMSLPNRYSECHDGEWLGLLSMLCQLKIILWFCFRVEGRYVSLKTNIVVASEGANSENFQPALTSTQQHSVEANYLQK